MKINEQVIFFRSELIQHKNEDSICKMKYVTFCLLKADVTIGSTPKALKVIFIEMHHHMFNIG